MCILIFSTDQDNCDVILTSGIVRGKSKGRKAQEGTKFMIRVIGIVIFPNIREALYGIRRHNSCTTFQIRFLFLTAAPTEQEEKEAEKNASATGSLGSRGG